MWRDRTIQDDTVTQSNTKGYLTFATAGKDTRTTQLFWNVANNKFLDKMGFAPIAKCVQGCEFMEQIEMKYREKPNQGTLQNKGNDYLKKNFPVTRCCRCCRFPSRALCKWARVNPSCWRVSCWHSTLLIRLTPVAVCAACARNAGPRLHHRRQGHQRLCVG